MERTFVRRKKRDEIVAENQWLGGWSQLSTPGQIWAKILNLKQIIQKIGPCD